MGPHCTAPTPNDIEWLLKHVRRQAVGTHPTGMLSCLSYTWNITGFPLGLENLQKWEGIFQSGNFEQTGKVRTGISDKYYLLFFSDI